MVAFIHLFVSYDLVQNTIFAFALLPTRNPRQIERDNNQKTIEFYSYLYGLDL